MLCLFLSINLSHFWGVIFHKYMEEHMEFLFVPFLFHSVFKVKSFFQVGEYDSVIIITHEPIWLLDWYWNDKTGKNISCLIRNCLNGRCKLWFAGDLHHYMRHSYVPSDNQVNVQHLVVNGCGGAFLHPTHVFKNFDNYYGTSYKSEAAYPSFEDSSRVMNLSILDY